MARGHTGMPSSRARTSSGFVSGMAVETTTTSGSIASMVSAAWPIVDIDAGARELADVARGLEVRPRYGVAALMQDERDAAHARSADTDEVGALESGRSGWGRGVYHGECSLKEAGCVQHATLAQMRGLARRAAGRRTARCSRCAAGRVPPGAAPSVSARFPQGVGELLRRLGLIEPRAAARISARLSALARRPKSSSAKGLPSISASANITAAPASVSRCALVV